MNVPTLTMSAIYPLRLRTDLPPDVVREYWANQHAEKVKRLPNLVEYNQYHFSSRDRGYWPGTPTVGTLIPPAWPLDGMTEVRMPTLGAAIRVPLHMREVFLDEQNFLEYVLGHLTGPGGGRWWTTGHDESLGHRTVLLLRRRRGVPGRAFRTFVHSQLGPALHAAGVRDLRTYTFLPLTAMAHTTFGVSHANPALHRYHGAVVFGASARADLDGIVASPDVARVVKDQHLTLTAVHAYAVDRTVPVIRAHQGP
jgi:hypothetical protein